VVRERPDDRFEEAHSELGRARGERQPYYYYPHFRCHFPGVTGAAGERPPGSRFEGARSGLGKVREHPTENPH